MVLFRGSYLRFPFLILTGFVFIARSSSATPLGQGLLQCISRKTEYATSTKPLFSPLQQQVSAKCETPIRPVLDVRDQKTIWQIQGGAAAAADSTRVARPRFAQTEANKKQELEALALKEKVHRDTTLTYLKFAEDAKNARARPFKKFKDGLKGPSKKSARVQAAEAVQNKIQEMHRACGLLATQKSIKPDEKRALAEFVVGGIMLDPIFLELGSTEYFYERVLTPLRDPALAIKHCLNGQDVFPNRARNPQAAAGILRSIRAGTSTDLKAADIDLAKYPFVLPEELELGIGEMETNLNRVETRLKTAKTRIQTLGHGKSEADYLARINAYREELGFGIHYYPAAIAAVVSCREKNEPACQSIPADALVDALCESGATVIHDESDRQLRSQVLTGLSIVSLPLAFLAPGPGTAVVGGLISAATLANSAKDYFELKADGESVKGAMTANLLDSEAGRILLRLNQDQVYGNMVSGMMAAVGLTQTAVSAGKAISGSVKMTGKAPTARAKPGTTGKSGYASTAEFKADIRNPAKSADDVLKKTALEYETGGKKVQTGQASFVDGKVPDDIAEVCHGCDKIGIEVDVPGQGRKELGYLSYTESYFADNTVKIGWVRVDQGARGQGIQDLLFKRLLEKRPDIKAIETSLDDVNHSVLQDEIVKRLKRRPDFKTNAETIPETVRTRMAKQSPSTQAMNNCCREYIQHLQKNDPKTLDAIIKDAARETPAWKSREKFGFTDVVAFDGQVTRPGDFAKNPTLFYVNVVHGKP